MKKSKILLAVAFISVCYSLIMASGQAYATDADILKKWTRINAFECIVDYKLLHSPVDMKDSSGKLKKTDALQTITSYQTDWVRTPSYGFGGTSIGKTVPCTQVLGYKNGYNGMTSLLAYGGMSNLAGIKWNDSSPSNIDKLLTALDYEGKETEDGGGRFSIKANRRVHTCIYPPFGSPTCSDSEWEASTVGITVTRNSDGTLQYKRDSGNFWNDLQVSFKDHNLILKVDPLTCTGGGSLEEPLQGDLNTMYANLEKSLTNTTWSTSCSTTTVAGTFATTTISDTQYTFGVTDKVVDTGVITQYELKDSSLESVANKVNSNLTGTPNRLFTDTEQYILYDFYLNKAIAESGASANRKTCNPTSTANLVPVRLLDTSDNTFKTCYVNLNQKDPSSIKVNAPNSNFQKIIEISMQDVIDRLGKLNTNSIDISAITGVDPSADPYAPLPGSGGTNDDDDTTVSQCIDAAGALGWILCPVLDMASDATENLYSYIAEKFLWVGSDVMGIGTSTHEAWKSFRNYANVAFIIMFLIVILSQVTGFGISNYGVKKILPRLIAVALLTNLSFIICQLAVDASDIIGSGINTLLTQVGGEPSCGAVVGETCGVDTIIHDARGALFGTSATVLFVGVLTWRIWLLPLLLAIIGALAGVFMFFLSLAIREAGIIILVVLCPVAIICYALPNTKKLFDKWFKMFSSLLMVYPICGLLMGGGQFASKLLIGLGNEGDQNIMFVITAMLLSVVPFFFIPTIVRTSLNAIGQLGARLSNFGRGISGRLTSGIRNSEGFRNRQRELAAQRDEKTVRRLDRWGKVRSAVGLKTYSKGGQRKRALAYARADKVRREDLLGQSYNGRSLLRDDKERERQLLGNLAAKDFDERVAGAKASYRDKPEMATEDAIVAEHDRLLDEFGNNPNDIRLQSQLRALEEMAMEKGAPGQDKLQRSFARYITQNKGDWNGNRQLAMSKLGAGMATRYGKELNGSDKGFNVMMNHLADGSITKEGRLESFQGDDASGYHSIYDAKLAGFTAAGMSKATPGALERGYDALRSGRMSTDDALTLTENATQAINDDIISKDLKPAEKGTVQSIVGYGSAARITSLEQGTLESISRFVGSTNDTEALQQLGMNIQNAADNGHAYSEAETRSIGMILNQINAKAGTSYKFDPASVQVDRSSQGGGQGGQSSQGNQGGQSGQQDIPEWMRVSDAERAQLEADAAKTGRRIK